jgi:mono/diheme cytochrome c family protein
VTTPINDDEDVYIPDTQKRVAFHWVAIVFVIPAAIMLFSLYMVLESNIRRQSDETLTPAALEDRSMEDASRLYINQCASCHGGKGQGLPGLGISLQNSVLSPEAIQIVIKEGRAMVGMPAFGQRFRPEDIAVMANYVDMFKKIRPTEKSLPN